MIFSRGAIRGLERCRRFLAETNPHAARRAALAIQKSLARLAAFPEMGRPCPGQSDLHELVIPFGDSGYLALYHFQPGKEIVLILAIRHQKEVDYYV